MNRSLRMAILPIMLLSLCSCSSGNGNDDALPNDNSDVNITENVMSIGNNRLTLASCDISIDNSNSKNLRTLRFFDANGNWVLAFISSFEGSLSGLPDGNYECSAYKSNAAYLGNYYWYEGHIRKNAEEASVKIKEGDFTVSSNNNNNDISFDCKSVSNEAIKGHYSGTIKNLSNTIDDGNATGQNYTKAFIEAQIVLLKSKRATAESQLQTYLGWTSNATVIALINTQRALIASYDRQIKQWTDRLNNL